MNIEKLQSGILDWFWSDPNVPRNFRSIENRCNNLFLQYYPEKSAKNAKVELFEPLWKSGIIEFRGNAYYQLSPTCILFSKRNALLVNFPGVTRQKLKLESDPLEERLGSVCYKKSDLPFDFLSNKIFPSRFYQIEQILSQIPGLETIIKSWDDNVVIDASSYLYYKQKWVPYPDLELNGVYKKGPSSFDERVCRLKPGTWKTIPSRDLHPDAFALAIIWSKIVSDNNLDISYQILNCRLQINEFIFPSLLERLLIINTLLAVNQDIDISKKQYFLEPTAFKIFNKLMGNKINIIYE